MALLAKARSRRNPNQKYLQPIHPNAGVTAAYRRKLDRLVTEMNRSVEYWVKAAYRANEPVIAQDDLPASALKAAIRKLTQRWQKSFDEAAQELAEYFAKAASERSDSALKNILKKGGFTVQFRPTKAQRDILQATINENVRLIKSIPAQYMTQVEGSVMRSVQTGRDLETLTKDLQDHYGVTKRRAAFIARDQNNKATAALTRARQIEIGVTEAVWVHSGGGKEPRPTHLRAGRDKQKYDVREGWYDPDADGKGKGRKIYPGELPNCRCVARSVIPGFS